MRRYSQSRPPGLFDQDVRRAGLTRRGDTLPRLRPRGGPGLVRPADRAGPGPARQSPRRPPRLASQGPLQAAGPAAALPPLRRTGRIPTGRPVALPTLRRTHPGRRRARPEHPLGFPGNPAPDRGPRTTLRPLQRNPPRPGSPAQRRPHRRGHLLVDAPRQRNNREENAAIQEGRIPEGWGDTPPGLAHQEIDARRTRKNGENHSGTENQVESNAVSKPIEAAVRDPRRRARLPPTPGHPGPKRRRPPLRRDSADTGARPSPHGCADAPLKDRSARKAGPANPWTKPRNKPTGRNPGGEPGENTSSA